MLAALKAHRAGNDRGFTLVEVTIILLVLVIISMIMLPQLGNYNRLARKVKVYEDLGAICATLKKFIDEVGVNGPWEKPGGGTVAPSGARVGLLIGPGNIPADTGTAVFHSVTTPASGAWATIQGLATHTIEPDAPGTPAAGTVSFGTDRFENHLQVNNPFGTSAIPTDRYVNTSENAAASFFLSWKGPYFDAFTPDPWGYRYMSNTFGLHTRPSPYAYFTSAVVCFSAGPDGVVSTPFNQRMDTTPYGWVTGGDDIAVVLSAGGPF